MSRESIFDLDTPALLLDLDHCETNLRTAVAFAGQSGVELRPHFKNHKCVQLARRQLALAHTVGMTCAKLAEAEILVAGGIADVLIANQVVGAGKIARLIALNRRASVRVAVESHDNALAISAAAMEAQVRVPVLLEVDIGMRRCGVSDPDSAIELAQRIADLPGLRFDGIQAYEGHTVGIADSNERQRAAAESMQRALDVRSRIEQTGLGVCMLSGGSTATYKTVGNLPGLTELQMGSYATMDWWYAERAGDDFAIALSVLATVISSSADRFVLDVGVKGLGAEMGPPKFKALTEARVPWIGSEEHCVAERISGLPPRVGEKLELWPSHCCTTCNLHREIVVHQQQRVVDRWPIDAAGALT